MSKNAGENILTRRKRRRERLRDEAFEAMLEALKWVGGHAYAGGKTFREFDPVKSAIALAEAFKADKKTA
jgi:nanoRNase/pAp phosphatase (c-di-AMP/oligoRNAs hydrolase)